MDYFLIDTSRHQAHIGISTIQALEMDFSCLTAKNNPNANIGSRACRKLLLNLQKEINLAYLDQPVNLNEQQFPYDFVLNKKKYWVNFSHSQTHVAVMVVSNDNKHLLPKFGIDIEDKRISDAVARRFFTQTELDWLHSLKIEQLSHAKKLLWTLKESLIKAQIKETLIAGLKNNVLQVLDKEALSDLLVEDGKRFNQVTVSNAVIGFSPTLKCGWVMIEG